MTLLGPNGAPISSADHARPRKNAGKPAVGAISATWQGGQSAPYLAMPGGVTVQFDTSRLTLGDFRRMSEHPQIAASINLLTFMVHQFDYQIVGGPEKVRRHVEENLEHIWTPLIRSLSSSFRFGFSANALQWENMTGSSRLWVNKIKDLVPEYSTPRWKEEIGAPLYDDNDKPIMDPMTGRQKYSKVEIFNGIRIEGDYPIPVENSLWHSLLMENGNMYGTKLLRTAFRPWFFHNLVMLFANSYYERFGNPLPIGRAPYDEKINVGTAENPKYETAPAVMRDVLTSIRNRSVVVLPSDRTAVSLNDKPEFDYQIELLEGTLRGAEFDKYLNYLNEEMSLALFTPSLLMRTGTSGSYNQGIIHLTIWQTILNALAADFKQTIDRYVLAPMAKHNFGKNVEAPKIVFRKLGRADATTMRAIAQELVRSGRATVDYSELGAQIGLSVAEVEELALKPDPEGEGGVNRDDDDKRVARGGHQDRDKTSGGTDPDNKTSTKLRAHFVAAGVSDPDHSVTLVRQFVAQALSLGSPVPIEKIEAAAIMEVEALG